MLVSEQPVDGWLDALTDPRSEDVRALDALIGAVFAGDSRVLWTGTMWGGTEQEIVGYGDLYQPRPKSEPVHWFVVGLALQKDNISIYVNAVTDGQYLGKVYGKALGKVKLGSASIGFRSLADVDLDVLAALLREARVLTSG